MNIFVLIITLIVWMIAVDMILESHDIGTRVAGHIISLLCLFVIFKITKSK